MRIQKIRIICWVGFVHLVGLSYSNAAPTEEQNSSCVSRLLRNVFHIARAHTAPNPDQGIRSSSAAVQLLTRKQAFDILNQGVTKTHNILFHASICPLMARCRKVP